MEFRSAIMKFLSWLSITNIIRKLPYSTRLTISRWCTIIEKKRKYINIISSKFYWIFHAPLKIHPLQTIKTKPTAPRSPPSISSLNWIRRTMMSSHFLSSNLTTSFRKNMALTTIDLSNRLTKIITSRRRILRITVRK